MALKYNNDSFLRNLVELYETDPGVVFAKFGGREETLLHRAALHRRIEMVEFLLEHEARQVEDASGNTPLHCAALGGDADVARALIEAGAELEAANLELDRPLHLAASVGNMEVLQVILDHGGDLYSRGCQDNTALHLAAQSAQVEVMEELVRRGLKIDNVNKAGEHPIHLAAGVAGPDKSIRHVEFLLEAGANIKKSRTKEGCTAAHYAARSGCADTLELLLDAECPVTKAKMQEDCRWSPVNMGDTLLESVAKSCCSQKGSLVLRRIMAARYKERRNRNRVESVMGRKEADRYHYEELTTHELELSHIYTELETSIDNPQSALRMFLQNCPEAFKCLLDNCLVASDERFTDNIGKVVFDFFLFFPEHDDNELAIVDLVIAAGKKKLVEHPLFETFIR